jgi:hypothetical protein
MKVYVIVDSKGKNLSWAESETEANQMLDNFRVRATLAELKIDAEAFYKLLNDKTKEYKVVKKLLVDPLDDVPQAPDKDEKKTTL